MPLWKTINQDYCALNELCDVHYPRLMSNMRRQSDAYAKQRSDSNQTATEAPGSRIAVLEASIQELAELKCQLSSVVERVRNNLLAYALSEDFSEHELAKVLQPVALRAYAYHVADLLGKSKPKDPYTPFHAIIQTLEQASNTVRLMQPPLLSLSSTNDALTPQLHPCMCLRPTVQDRQVAALPHHYQDGLPSVREDQGALSLFRSVGPIELSTVA